MKDIRAKLEKMDNKLALGFNQINSKMVTLFDETMSRG